MEIGKVKSENPYCSLVSTNMVIQDCIDKAIYISQIKKFNKIIPK
jgi:hypothetical protein